VTWNLLSRSEAKSLCLCFSVQDNGRVTHIGSKDMDKHHQPEAKTWRYTTNHHQPKQPTVDGRNPASPEMNKTVVNNGILPNINWWSPDFWTINSMTEILPCPRPFEIGVTSTDIMHYALRLAITKLVPAVGAIQGNLWSVGVETIRSFILYYLWIPNLNGCQPKLNKHPQSPPAIIHWEFNHFEASHFTTAPVFVVGGSLACA